MMVCCCSSPACMVNGCQQAAQYRNQYAPNTDPHRIGQATPVPTLTPDDIRRIVREEIERAAKEAK